MIETTFYLIVTLREWFERLKTCKFACERDQRKKNFVSIVAQQKTLLKSDLEWRHKVDIYRLNTRILEVVGGFYSILYLWASPR